MLSKCILGINLQTQVTVLFSFVFVASVYFLMYTQKIVWVMMTTGKKVRVFHEIKKEFLKIIFNVCLKFFKSSV